VLPQWFAPLRPLLSGVRLCLLLYPFLGYGLGLRSAYYQQILEQSPDVDWFEVVSENFMVQGGKALYYLDAIAERYPLVMHGVSLSIGGPHALDPDYLQQLKQLADRVQTGMDLRPLVLEPWQCPSVT
jgi:hypothetical protein